MTHLGICKVQSPRPARLSRWLGLHFARGPPHQENTIHSSKRDPGELGYGLAVQTGRDVHVDEAVAKVSRESDSRRHLEVNLGPSLLLSMEEDRWLQRLVDRGRHNPVNGVDHDHGLFSDVLDRSPVLFPLKQSGSRRRT